MPWTSEGGVWPKGAGGSGGLQVLAEDGAQARGGLRVLVDEVVLLPRVLVEVVEQESRDLREERGRRDHGAVSVVRAVRGKATDR